MTILKSGAVLATLVLALTASCPPPTPTPAPAVTPASCPAPTLKAEDGSCVNPNYWDAPATPQPVPVPEQPACKVD
jgi:hypothetical protein